MAIFARDRDLSHGAWTVVLRFNPAEAAFEIPATGTAEFLNHDEAPDWLETGVTFEMMEGRRVTAHVIVQ